MIALSSSIKKEIEEHTHMSRIMVMAKNEVGVIADISRVLADNGINIETISTESLDDKGSISLTTDDYDGALRALTDAGFKTVTDDSLIVSLKDEPGALAKVAEKLKAGRREHSEPAHSRTPRRLHYSRNSTGRPRKGGGSSGQRVHSLGLRWELALSAADASLCECQASGERDADVSHNPEHGLLTESLLVLV